MCLDKINEKSRIVIKRSCVAGDAFLGEDRRTIFFGVTDIFGESGITIDKQVTN